MTQLDVSNQVKNVLSVANGGTGDTGNGGYGWVSSNETWTYASASDALSTYTFTVPSDVTTKYSEGMKVKFNQTLTSPLTSYFTMDTDGNDSVGTASVTNTNVTFSTGKFGNGAVFNGTTSKLVITDNATLKPTGDFTVGMWVKTASTATQGLFQCYSNNGVQAASGYAIQLVGGRVEWTIANNTEVSATLGVGYTALKSGRVISDNAWHYVVVTYRNNIQQIYIDGELDTSGYCRTPAYSGTVYTTIGATNSSVTTIAFFSGMLDDIFFINGNALDGETIKSKYLLNEAQTNNSITITKYGLISASPTYSSPNTTITLYCGCDYKLTNTTISNPYFSVVKSPYKFPVKEIKFTQVEPLETNTTQASPVGATWYNLGSQSLQVGVGSWNIEYKTYCSYINSVTISTNLYSTLATLNNTETHKHLTLVSTPPAGTSTQLYSSTIVSGNVCNPITATYYLLIKSLVLVTSINTYGEQTQCYIKAVSAYI